VNAPSEVRVLPDLPALSVAAAVEVVRAAEEAVAARGVFALALAGGSTPRALYALLADPTREFCGRMPWDRMHLFLGDERHVPADHPESNYRMVHLALLSKVPVPASHVHRVRAELEPDRAAAEYERELRSFFGREPSFDLVLLGMGADGHTASLFPGTAALEERERWVVATWVEKLRAHRITLTLPVLERARAVLFLVAGADKAPALARVLSPRAGEEPLPAARVRPAQGRLLWFVDRAAAVSLDVR
jgi:6-phosphogluconolactonase